MKISFKLISIVMLLLFLSSSENKETINVENGLWITNVSIVSPEFEKITPYVGTVVVNNDQIVYVGPDDVNLTGNYKKIDGTSKFIIPGLIDSHVHLSSIAGMNYRQSFSAQNQ